MNNITYPLKTDMHGAPVADLQNALQQYLDQGSHLVSDAFNALFQVWHLFEKPTKPTPEPSPEPSASSAWLVDGKVASRVSASVGGLSVVIVDKNVGGDTQLAQAVTDDRGAYKATFSDRVVARLGKAQPDLQAQVFSGKTLLGASAAHYNASRQETLNVLLADTAVANLLSEHETLSNALSAQYSGRLRDLKETEEQQDITYLANKTGWDARAVALAALADQFSAQSVDSKGNPTIPQLYFYALFRAGLPANEDMLYHTDASTLESVWMQAAAQGVIPKASVQQIPVMAQRFQSMSVHKLLTGKALIGASSFSEMLNVSKLNEAQQKRFAELYTANRTDMETLWKIVGEDSTFGASPQQRSAVVSRLQVDSKLAFLTINNAVLINDIHDKVGGEKGLSDPLQLAQSGYHRADAWNRLLTNVPIPKEIPGSTPEAQKANYAEYLAAQVRLSYPTASVAQMVQSRELLLTGAAPAADVADVHDSVHAFLTAHQGKFEIGMEPVEQYIRKNNVVDVANETVTHIKRLQRVYQMTPTDKAMTGLMKRGVDSACHVVGYDRSTFVKSFAADLGDEKTAAETYDRSVQIHGVVLNIALSYLHARTAPAIGASSQSLFIDPAPANLSSKADKADIANLADTADTVDTTDTAGIANTGDIIAYPTLESLFGSMDFCSCDHCRSILSPAAYLVDLLQFIYSDDEVWSVYVKNWKTDNGAPYPYLNQAAFSQAGSHSNTEISPFQVLMSRRPDIQHLPLTCENTNTALPYIDIVNETLEYFIVSNLSLTNYEGHDTNNATSEDLLASPQFVMDTAYETLCNERFPAPLPFHRSLENLRRYFNKFEVPLPLAMERLRKNDLLDIDRTTNPPADYGWRDILMEELQISRAEYELLTNSPNAVSLWQMFGFPSSMADVDVIDGLSNAKQFSKRIGITYIELIALLRSRFVNPNADLLPKIEKLGVSFATLKALKDGQTSDGTPFTDANFLELLPTGLAAPDPAEYGDDITAWVKNEANYQRIMSLITLTIPVSEYHKDTKYKLGDCVRPASPSTDVSIYFVCTSLTPATTLPTTWVSTPGDKCNIGNYEWTCRNITDCASFENMAFRYTDPEKLNENIDAVGFVRMLRFVRLWKKLGWKMEQTDAAICTLLRADMMLPLGSGDIDNVSKVDNGFMILLPRLGIVSRVMHALHLTVKRDLLSFLACFSPIGTHDSVQWIQNDEGGLKQQIIPSLYRQMFLNPTILQQDNVFADNGYGEFLNGNTEKIADHVNALRSAFNVTGDEYDQIVSALGYTQNTPLTIFNISEIYRRGWLARKLKISVRELLLLIEYTGLDPFAVPDLTNPAMLRLIELVQKMKSRSFKSAVALYLMWNQDLSGKSAPTTTKIAEFARTLRNSLTQIENELIVADDPTGEITRARMALVYGNEAAEFFFTLLNNSLVTEIPFSRQQADLTTEVYFKRTQPATFLTSVPYKHNKSSLENDFSNAVPGITYDDSKNILSFSGTLDPGKFGILKSKAEDLITDNATKELFKAAIDAIYQRNSLAVEANLEQEIVDAAPEISYKAAAHKLCFKGALSKPMHDALDQASVAIKNSDDQKLFLSAADNLFNESQLVAHSNLEQELVDASDGLLVYDDYRKVLSYTGMLSDAVCSAIKSAAIAIANVADNEAFVKAIDDTGIDEITADGRKIVKNLKEKYHNVIDPFFGKYPELQPLSKAYRFFLTQRCVASFGGPVELPSEIVAAGQNKIMYDPNAEQLSYAGVLSDAAATALKDAANAIVDASVKSSFVNAVDMLATANHTDINNLFSNDAVALNSYTDAYIKASNSPEKQRTVLLGALLPSLIKQRKAQQALQVISTVVSTDLTFTQTILNSSKSPFALYAVSDKKQAGLSDFLALETYGLTAQFFAYGAPIETPISVPFITANLEYGNANSLPKNPAPGDAISGVWQGYLEAPESGFFNLRIKADNGATVTLQLQNEGNAPVNLTQDAADTTLWENQNQIELRAGTLYPLTLKVENVRDVVSMQWEWEPKGQGRAVIPARYLYPATLFDSFQKTYVRFLKSASIAKGLGLTANELAFFATHPDYQVDSDGWLNALPVNGDPAQATAFALLKPFEALLDFARIKAEISPGDESLLTLLKDPATATQTPDSLLFSITRWNQTSLSALLTHFTDTIADLEHFELFRRVYDAYALCQTMGISPSSLIQATTNEPVADTVSNLQAALRALYDAESWRDVVRPINDEMRGLQRDALVACILHQMRIHPESAHIDTPDKLFEFFLMDVQMEPCMQTSRIRHALSSVQLFIDRCLLNLEPRVSPAAINAKQWEWMKRYRVWEANRKVYLFPENWLEPELRDDQSPFFKETMSELLQGDITEDRASVALLNYLSKLEEVAKLEPCGIYHDENTNIEHVVARTAGAHRKYYYRRKEGSSWTPWEQIKLDIEDNPVIPVVWNDRLFLFWLRILKQSPTSANIPDPGRGNSMTALTKSDINKTADPKITVQAVLCWSEYYNGKWQASKTSDVNNPTVLGNDYSASGRGSFNRENIYLRAIPENDALRIAIIKHSGPSASFLLYNTHSLPEPSEKALAKQSGMLRHWYTPQDSDDFMFIYSSTSTNTDLKRKILTPPISYDLVQQKGRLDNWDALFVFADSRHVFYVTTKMQPVWIHSSKLNYGIFTDPDKICQIPPLALEVEPPVSKKLWGDGGPVDSGFVLIDQPQMESYVTQDAFICNGIGMTGTVGYGNSQIGPSGVTIHY